MSIPPAESRDERLLTFEIGSSLFALPISGVVEVTEIEHEFASVPTIPAHIGGVINFHGDALPVLWSSAVLGVESDIAKFPAQIVVLTDRPTEQARLGLPVDEILGLVNGPGPTVRGKDPVAERRPIDGRVAKILDPARLLAKAEMVIESTNEGTG